MDCVGGEEVVGTESMKRNTQLHDNENFGDNIELYDEDDDEENYERCVLDYEIGKKESPQAQYDGSGIIDRFEKAICMLEELLTE